MVLSAQSNNFHDVHLLVVDDDDRIRALLKKYLTQTGFRVSAAADASEAERLMKGLSFDLIVLDVMMPGEDGFTFTERLRKIDTVPIILLTARGDKDDRIAGLRLGADDYLPKPFEPEELVLRIQSILKRQAVQPKARRIVFGSFLFDLDRNVLSQGQENIHLTTGELALLSALARKTAMPVSRSDLADQMGAKSERAVDVQVTRLRGKIEANQSRPEYLITVRNQGYCLQAEPNYD